MKVYRSRFGWEIWLPVLLIIAAQIPFMVAKKIWIGLFILAIVTCFIALLISSIKYVIDDNFLVIRSLIAINNQKIDIRSIYRIRKTNNPISAPAASLLGRIEVYYNNGNSVIISPQHKKQFITALTEINKSILTHEAF